MDGFRLDAGGIISFRHAFLAPDGRDFRVVFLLRDSIDACGGVNWKKRPLGYWMESGRYPQLNPSFPANRPVT